MSDAAVEPKKEDDWMQKKWRPAMGWMYMFICILDMAIFPVMWSLVQVMMGQAVTQWDPLTLKGAGLFHLAMGAVLGIAAWGRTQEKLGGAASNTAPAPIPPAPISTQTPPTQAIQRSPTPAPSQPVYREETYYEPQGQIIMGYGGRPAPAPAPQPLI